MWSNTFLQTLHLLDPLISYGGLLAATLGQVHSHWAGKFPPLDVGLCAWDAPRRVLRCQHSVVLFKPFGRFCSSQPLSDHY